MMKTRGWRLLGASVCTASLLLAGCGGDDEPGGGDSESHGPLAEFFGWDDEFRSGDEEASEEERQLHFQVQEHIVVCMREAGFEYNPEPFWADQDGPRGGFDDPNEEIWQLQQDDPEAFARQYGYGATTIEYDTPGLEGEEVDPSEYDPNYEYREGLSEAAREEYEKALWGEYEEGEVDGDGAIAEPAPVDPGGCQNEAYEEFYGFGEEEAQFEDLWEKWDQLYQGIEDDARMTEVVAAWSSCMADAGYPGLENLWDGQDQVYERQSELYGWDDEAIDPSAVEGEASGSGEAEPSPGPSEEFEPDPDDLAELRDFELALAWADFECKRDHDVERIEREVRFEHEERFIEQNRTELEAYRDWQNENQRGVG